MPPLRLGVIGLGLIWSRVHQPNLAVLPELFAPVAFCDLDAARRAAAAQAFPGAPVYTNPAELLADPNVEAVLVLTPIAYNAPTALAALQAGKHVLMEKPIARSVAEGRALIDVAAQAKRRLFVTEQMGYRRAEEITAEIIASGAIGDIVLWERIFHLEPDPGVGSQRYDSTPWRKAADFPLGTLFDGGIHQIALLNRVYGAPNSVDASGRRLRAEYGEYDHVTLHFHYAGGFAGFLSHSVCLPPQNHYRIYGTAGTLVVEPDRLIVQQPQQPARTIPLPTENAYALMWAALGEAWHTGRAPAYTAEHALRDVAILEAVDRSLKTHARVSLAPEFAALSR